MASPEYHPPVLPVAALEVHRLPSQSGVDLGDIVTVLERDVTLAAEVLRFARSTHFARATPPSSLRDAVSRLGLSNVRDLVFRISLESRVFRAPGYQGVMESLRGHSVASAKVARHLAAGSPQGDYTFLVGLLHDVGAVAVVLAMAQLQKKVAPESLATVIHDLHEEVGAALLESWKLPESLRAAIDGHHHPSDTHSALAYIAHTISTENGFGLDIDGFPVSTFRPVQFARACEIVRLDEAGLESLRGDAADFLQEE